jgi:ADP-heptose:LPS heptosyltransferase
MENTNKTIVIFPYSRKLRNGKINPKNWPQEYWVDLVKKLKEQDYYITQVGTSNELKIDGIDEFKINLSLDELKQLILSSSIWISVDSFAQHLAHLVPKPGIVLFGQSDPLIFGHKENINLIKDRTYLREKQFDIWECAECNNEAFVEPSVVLDAVCKRRQL